MRLKFIFRMIAMILAPLFLLSPVLAAGPEDELAGDIKIALGKNFGDDWDALERLPGIKWGPLPPKMLQNCLPDGGCFTRQGTATLGGRNLVVLATGARTIVSNLYFRNAGVPIGEAAVLAALKRMNLSADLSRCPVPGGTGGTNWYRLKSSTIHPGILAIQTSCSGRPCEGFTLTQGEDLPRLQPAQLKLYSEQCSGAPSARKPVSTVLPHEQLAQAIATLIPPVTGPALYNWKGLSSLLTDAVWPNGGPKKTDLSYKGDSNPYSMSGQIKFSGRVFYLLASGTPTDVKSISFEEGGMHPSGEHMLGVLYTQGYAVKLVRCGPVYTESTNNWYSVTSNKSRPVMLQQSIRYEGKQVQDSYELRLDGTLPKRDPRDRDPGVGGCR